MGVCRGSCLEGLGACRGFDSGGFKQGIQGFAGLGLSELRGALFDMEP